MPIMVTWTFVIPISLFAFIRKNKEKLESVKNSMAPGFLYKEYKKE